LEHSIKQDKKNLNEILKLLKFCQVASIANFQSEEEISFAAIKSTERVFISLTDSGELKFYVEQTESPDNKVELWLKKQYEKFTKILYKILENGAPGLQVMLSANC
jgi:hypothetical protein